MLETTDNHVPFILSVRDGIEKPILVKARGEAKPILYVSSEIRQSQNIFRAVVKKALETILVS